MTEGAKVLLREAGYERESAARRAVGAAAYYLSDALDPDTRLDLVMAAEVHLGGDSGRRAPEHNAAAALVLANDASRELEQMVRRSSASSELRIALRAVRCAIAELTRQVRLRSSRMTLRGLRSHRLTELRGL